MRLRLQKFIAQSGRCSRRAAESLIKDGKIIINGHQTALIGDSIDPERDTVSVDGTLLKPLNKQYFLFHKPAKVLCSRKDPVGRSCFYDLLPSSMQHVVYAGRLDFMSEGLLVLSNDGEFTHRLTHPKFGYKKKYQVSVKGIRDLGFFVHRIVSDGVLDQGERLRAQKASILSKSKHDALLEIVLLEGRNREIRRMVEIHGGMVTRLFRQEMGPFSIQGIKCSHWRKFNQNELRMVDQLISEKKSI